MLPRLSLAFLIALLVAVALVWAPRRGGRAAPPGPDVAPSEAPPPREDVAPVERFRGVPREVPAEEEAVAVPLAPEEPEGEGVLWVIVEGRETREALEGVRTLALLDRVDAEEVLVYGERHRGTHQDSLLTDVLGKAEYLLPAGRRIRLVAWDETRGLPRQEVEVAPLEPSEEREVVVRFVLAPESLFVGEVVSAGGAQVEATVGVYRGSELLQELQASGPFYVWQDLRVEPYLLVTAPGYSTAVVPLSTGHESLETRQRIPLIRSAKVLVVGPLGEPMVGTSVTFRVRMKHLLQGGAREASYAETAWWSSSTDEQGRCTVGSLPASVPLEVVLAGPGEQEQPEPVVLEPGETRELVFRFLPPAMLRGRLVDRTGKPVPGKEVWLLDAGSGPWSAGYVGCAAQAAARSEDTARDGSFEFPGVYEGRYLVGPCPACPGDPAAGLPRTYNRQQVAPVFSLVRVISGKRNEVELSVDRGLFVEGSIVDRDGRPILFPRLAVTAKDPRGPVGGGASPAGSFSVGPLQRGTLELQAYVEEPEHPERMESRPRRVHAGASEVELVIESTVRGRIQGFALDGTTGKPARTVVETAVGKIELMERTHPLTGEFVFEALPPGEYTLTSLWGAGSQTVHLQSWNGEVRGVILWLEPDTGLRIYAWRRTAGGGLEACLTGDWDYRVRSGGYVKEGSFSGARSPLVLGLGRRGHAEVALTDRRTGESREPRAPLDDGITRVDLVFE